MEFFLKDWPMWLFAAIWFCMGMFPVLASVYENKKGNKPKKPPL